MAAKLANRSHIRTPPTTLTAMAAKLTNPHRHGGQTPRTCTAMAAKLPGRVEGAGAG